MNVIDDLRALSVGDRVRVETDDGDEYAFRVVDAVDYVAPDEYGAGHLEVPIEFDPDAQPVPSDELPSETGRVMARRADADSLERPRLSVKAVAFEEHTGGRAEEWQTLGQVASIEVREAA